MSSGTRQRAPLVLALVVAAAMIGSAYFRIGPEHTWLYLVFVWAIISAAFEVTGRSKDGERGWPRPRLSQRRSTLYTDCTSPPL